MTQQQIKYKVFCWLSLKNDLQIATEKEIERMMWIYFSTGFSFYNIPKNYRIN